MDGTLGSLQLVDGVPVATAPQFRFMGQRYILDSEIFYRLTYIGPGGGRPFPKGLDFAAALGSRRAYSILTEVYKEQDKWEGYLPNMKKMQEKIRTIDQSKWTSNLYMGWLWAVSSLIEENRSYYPSTLKGDSYHDKQLNTFLGNWAEARHDTILYAKQSEPQCGSAMPKKDVS